VGDVVAQYADYTSALVEHAGAPLGQTLNASFWTSAPAPGLPGAVQPAAAAGELTLAGATFGLAAVAGFPQTLAGYAKNPVIDAKGRWASTSVGTPVETVAGTPNQVNASCASGACTLSLYQDLAPASSPAFAAVVVGGTTLAGAGAATVTLPAITGTAVVTAGAQTLTGAKTFAAAPVVAGDVGAVLNNAGNTFATTLRAAAGLAASNDVRLPAGAGAAGNVVATDGAGAWSYAVNGAALARARTTTAVATSGAFASLYGTVAGSLTIPANTLQPGVGIKFAHTCAYVLVAGTCTARVVLGGTTLVTSSTFTGATAALAIEGTAWVTTAGRIVVRGTVLRATTVAAVLTQTAPVLFVPASALAFDVQVSTGGSTFTCYGTMNVIAETF
jgi:hypothetical protein